jgi:hypothetical protein
MMLADLDVVFNGMAGLSVLLYTYATGILSIRRRHA